MKRFALTLVLSLMAFALVGCSSADQSPLQRADAINETFILTVDALTEAKNLGYISPDQARELVPYIDAGNAARRAVSKAAREGSKDEPFSDFRAAVSAFNDAFDVLLNAKMQAEETKAAVKRATDRSPIPVPE